GCRLIGNAVGGTRWNLESFADREPVAMIRTPGLDGELTSQHEIMVRALAVIMPGNDIAVGQRKDTNLNVRADNDGFDAFHLVVGHLDAFRPIKECSESPLAPMTRRESRQPASPAAARVWRSGQVAPYRRAAWELASLQLIELHFGPRQPGPDCRIPN